MLAPLTVDLATLLVTVAVGAATLASAATWAVASLWQHAGRGARPVTPATPAAQLLPLRPPPAGPHAATDGEVTITATSPEPGKGATISRPCSACASPPLASADPTDTRPRTGYLSWDDYFMALAFLSAQRSKDPSKQVGACIVSPDRIILGIGYNGFPRGCPDDALPWAKRAPAPPCLPQPGGVAAAVTAPPRFPPGVLGTKYPYVCHAEMNAILNKNATSLAGASLYVTMFPCNECSKLLIQAGIREVVFYEDKHANAEAPGVASSAAAAGVGGMAPSEAYTASRTLLALAGVAVRQHAPATALVLQVAPLQAEA